jgi:hypothetical protein
VQYGSSAKRQHFPSTDFYAIFIPSPCFLTPFLFASTYSGASFCEITSMDFVYLLLLIVLIAGTTGFLRLCARLETDK